jgi:hypothetical protein
MLLVQATKSIRETIESEIGLSVGSAGASGDALTIGSFVSAALPYLYTFGGIIFFGMIVWGGFEMLAGANEPKSQEQGKQRITAAAIGFLLLFTSYWIAQLLQIVFGVTTVGR